MFFRVDTARARRVHRHTDARIVVRMDAERAGDLFLDVCQDIHHLERERSTVRVTQDDAGSATRLSCLERQVRERPSLEHAF